MHRTNDSSPASPPRPLLPRIGRAPILVLLVALAACGDGSTDPVSPPATPAALVANAVSDVRIALTWEAPDGHVEAVHVERAPADGTFQTVAILARGQATYEDDGLAAATVYRYRLQTCGDGGCSGFAAATASTLPSLVLSAPALPSLVVGTPLEAALSVLGGPGGATVTVVSGSLPDGLSLSAAGVIAGTPTAAGTHTPTLQADAVNGQRATLTLTLAVSRPLTASGPGEFAITALQVAPLSSGVAAALDEAIARWESAIVGDVADDVIPGGFFGVGDCDGFGALLNGEVVDDILVVVNIRLIDGPGNILGEAGPCAVRNDLLPVVGILTLDAADIEPLVGTETLVSMFFHEIGHILGFGTVWWDLDLLKGSRRDPRFVGATAVEEYEALGGLGGVLVENQGGAGTADSHWRETTFEREVMTGYVEAVGVAQPLSRVTIASMRDLGYEVDFSAADAYVLPGAALKDDVPPPAPLGIDVVRSDPIRVLPR